MRRKKDKAKNFRLLSWFFGTLGGAVLIAGIIISLQDLRSNMATNQRVAKLINQANHGISHVVPSTNKVSTSEFNSYQVGPTLPRYIFIPKLSIQAIVRPLGLTPDGQLDTPHNVYDTGWYSASSKPGYPGVMVVDGHVSSWTTNGVFYGLKNLSPGDNIKVERGDGSMVSYRVVKEQVYEYQEVDMTAVLSPINPNKSGLNLITCTGDVIKGTNEFNKRIVVFAEEM